MATEGEEAFVESVEDPLMGEPGDDRDHFSQSHFHQQQQQQSPTGFSYVFMVVMSVNPWLYVVLGVALYFLWRRFGPQLQTRLQQWREAREEARETAHMKKNPDLYRERMEAIDLQRRRMQERYDQEASEAAEREAEREEERRKQKVAELENLLSGKGYRNKVKVERAEFSDGVDRSGGGTSNRRPGTLRPGYNPLMGPSGSSGYRPARRNLNSGG